MWHAWLERESKEIWEHQGLCACGRRTRLFGQCMQCIAPEHAENVQVRAEQEAAEREETHENAKIKWGKVSLDENCDGHERLSAQWGAVDGRPEAHR